MDDSRLKVFVAAARLLNFSRAADQLHITQPAVSKQICKLETDYKVELFKRCGSTLELTPAGSTMLDHAEKLLEGYRLLKDQMDLCAGETEGELHLGASTTISQYLLPPILARFTARFPDVRVSLLSGNSDQIEQAVLSRRIDLGMVENLHHRQELHYFDLAPDELVLVARSDGKLRHMQTVTLDELRRIPLVLREDGSGTLDVISKVLAAKGIRLSELNVVMRLGTTEGIKAFVRNSDAMAIVSVTSLVDELRSNVLRIVDIEGVELFRKFSFVRAETIKAPLSWLFVEFVELDHNR